MEINRRRRVETVTGWVIVVIAGAWLLLGPRAILSQWYSGAVPADGARAAFWTVLALGFLVPGALYCAGVGLLYHRVWAPRVYIVAFLVPQVIALLLSGTRLWREAGGLTLASYGFLWAEFVALLPLALSRAAPGVSGSGRPEPVATARPRSAAPGLAVATLVVSGSLLVLATVFFELGHPVSLLIAGIWAAVLVAVAVVGLAGGWPGTLGRFALITAVAVLSVSAALALLIQGQLPAMGEMRPLIWTGLLWVGRAPSAAVSRDVLVAVVLTPAVTMTSLLLLVGMPLMLASARPAESGRATTTALGGKWPRVTTGLLLTSLLIPFVMGLPAGNGRGSAFSPPVLSGAPSVTSPFAAGQAVEPPPGEPQPTVQPPSLVVPKPSPADPVTVPQGVEGGVEGGVVGGLIGGGLDAPTETIQPKAGMPVIPWEEASSQLLSRVEPKYPRRAFEARRPGVVVMQIEIGPDGRVHNPRPLFGLDEFAESAKTAVMQWRFRPFLVQGQPVAVTTRYTFIFRVRVQ